jgi:methionyl-tRNA synthetase
MSKFYLTTPIYYVNDKPHIGHAYTTIAADVLARYHRLRGEEVFFLTGTDEHGEKVAQSAQDNNKSPQEFCDENSAKFALAWDVLNITNDDFIRTTQKRHEKVVETLFNKLKKAKTPKGNNVIYEGDYEGLYCVGCEKYITEKELDNGKCADHQKAPELLKEKNWFFRLSDYEDILKKKIESNDIQVLPATRQNEILSFIKQGLEDVAISRPSVKWGIPLPWDKEQTIYVWIEALMNYLSAITPLTPHVRGATNVPLSGGVRGGKWWPADVHLMAKDIVKFHAVIWPAMLLALALDLPRVISAHGFFTIDGQKMSKSLGNVLDPVELAQEYGTDPLRYYLMREVPYGNDGDVSTKRFERRYVSDLQNGLGNLVSRVFALADKEQFTPVDFQVENEEKIGSEIQAKVKQVWDKYEIAIDNFQFSDALIAIWELIAFCDNYITQTKLWTLVDDQQEEFVKIMYNLLETIRHVAWMIQPFMPETSKKIIKQLFVDDKNEKKELSKSLAEVQKWGGLQPEEIKVEKGEVLFPRLNLPPRRIPDKYIVISSLPRDTEFCPYCGENIKEYLPDPNISIDSPDLQINDFICPSCGVKFRIND